MIHIVCLKWGEKYGPEYVNNLFYSVRKNTTLPFKFHCFTDKIDGIDESVVIHSLPYKNIEIWWNKLYLFSKEINIPLGEKVFYIDLDTLITDNIDDLLSVEVDKIVMLRDFLVGLAQTCSTIASGLMAWRHGDYDYVWSDFIKDPQAAIESVHPHGDQGWIEKCITEYNLWQELYPRQVVSFKVHCLNGLPADAAIVCYHGRPSIPESISCKEKIWKFQVTPQPWVSNYWGLSE